MKAITKKIVGLGLALSPLAGTLAQEQPRNVLFIAVDDLKPLLGCYGDPIAKTPNFDRLAQRGVVFQNTYCQQAVCAPSRASLMSGKRPDYTQVWDLQTLVRDRVPDIVMLPQYFRQNGYVTTGTGKIYDRRSVDGRHDRQSWSVPFQFEGDTTLYDPASGMPALGYYQLPETKALSEKYMEEARQKGKKNYGVTQYAINRVKPSTECADVPDHAYGDGVLAETAIAMLKQLSQKDKPFFLGLGFKRPHLPFVSPKKYWDLYKRDEMPLAPYQKASKNGPLLAYHNSGELRSYTDIPPLKSFSDIDSDLLSVDKQKELIHGYYASVSYVDAQLGKVLDALDQLGLSKNTVIVLWGDHGWHLGDHGLWCKHTNFEQATHAPLIVAAPGIKSGENNAPTEFVDIFPTVCELAGLKVPANLDGKSLVPVLKGEAKAVNDYAVSQFPRGKAMGYAFRTDRYRYVVWVNENFRSSQPFSENLVVAEELYDYQKDPLETNNFAVDAGYKDVLKKMQQQSRDYFRSQEDPSRKVVIGEKAGDKKKKKIAE